MASVALAEIAKIPYVDSAQLAGRTLSTLTFYDEDEWHLWLPVGDRLQAIKGWSAEGFYFSKAPEAESDVYFEFLDFTAQRACWPSIVPCLTGIRDDLFNVTASLRKFQVLFEASGKYKTESSRFVVTELEYLFSICRSIFDLLQETIRHQWDTVQLLDTSIKKKVLPKTFSKVVLSGELLRNANDISEKFAVPTELAEYYARHAQFFQLLRTFRDRFVHGGSSIRCIFVTEQGFAVRSSTEPFATFNVWNTEHQQKNGLCSLRPAIAYLVSKTLEACDDYARTVQKIIKYPPSIVPGMMFYMRGPFTSEFHTLKPVIQNCSWWKNA